MKHKKYEHIEGIWKTDTVEYFRSKGVFNEVKKWCITEKVHGSNYSIYYDGKEMKFASRNRFIKPASFFNSDIAVKREMPKIMDLYNLLSKQENAEKIIVYGELCGGSYPHEDVPIVNGINQIQKGVYYHPNIIFVVFDIMVNGEFLSPLDVVFTTSEVGLYSVPILKVGTFEECVDYGNKFITRIPILFGLPEIKDNICEGVVIRPLERDVKIGDNRVIFKSKNDKHYERQKAPKKPHKPNVLPKKAQEAIDILAEYVNENRLRNVLSKIGPFGEKDFKKVFDAFKEDVYESFNAEHNHLKGMFEKERRQIDRYLGKICTEIWRPIYLKERQ